MNCRWATVKKLHLIYFLSQLPMCILPLAGATTTLARCYTYHKLNELSPMTATHLHTLLTTHLVCSLLQQQTLATHCHSVFRAFEFIMIPLVLRSAVYTLWSSATFMFDCCSLFNPGAQSKPSCYAVIQSAWPPTSHLIPCDYFVPRWRT